MNERIKEIETQCWEPRKHPVSQAAMGDKFNTEKFAELIIRECASLAYDGPSGILEHFGVEE